MAIDLDLLLKAYASGIFPMADARDDPDVFWVEPKARAVIPLDNFQMSRSLRKTIRSDRFRVTADTAFADVIDICATQAADRKETWINAEIEEAFVQLHQLGHAHSIECWQADETTGEDRLVGGLYGLAIGGAFCGESMFSRSRDASKVALAWLVARLNVGGFELLDCQFMTDHLASLGAIEISQDEYVNKLRKKGQGLCAVVRGFGNKVADRVCRRSGRRRRRSRCSGRWRSRSRGFRRCFIWRARRAVGEIGRRPSRRCRICRISRRLLFSGEAHRAAFDPDIVNRMLDHIQGR